MRAPGDERVARLPGVGRAASRALLGLARMLAADPALLILFFVALSILSFLALCSLIGSAAGTSVIRAMARQLTAGLGLVQREATGVLLAVAGVGILTTALLEAYKTLHQRRRRFNQQRMDEWVLRLVADAPQPVPLPPHEVISDLLYLATDGDEEALYELKAPQLAKKISNALQFTIVYPADHEVLLRAIAGRAGRNDVDALIQRARNDEDPFRVRFGLEPGRVDRSYTELAMEAARTRLGLLVSKRVDAFHTSLASGWQRWNKSSAFRCSFLLVFLTLLLSRERLTQSNPEDGLLVRSAEPLLQSLLYFWVAAVFALIAAFLAPVAKDLTAAVQRLRQP